MISALDFEKKQIVIAFFNAGEKLAFQNDNVVVKNKNDTIKFQCTCYRVFLIMAIGYCSISSGLIQRAKKFGFSIVLLTPSIKVYGIISASKDGNTMLKRKQYDYNDITIAQHLVKNKIMTEYYTLQEVRKKDEDCILRMREIKAYYNMVSEATDIRSIMGYEGLASKAYFKAHFNNVEWEGRKPRVKQDIVNSALDIGYTLLFSFIEAILEAFGFDTYCGVLHRQFYMRKSLVCDIVEPFRYLIDKQVKKSINLKQIKKEDFKILDRQYCLEWQHNARYVAMLMKPIIDNKDQIFKYVQAYYRCFMKESDIKNFPVFIGEQVEYGLDKL